ncbi:MarR family winged helix-turn-helix transcriptional regulator [Arsenicibacter rosenii]|uniref:MarR family transcriptional regulator n=1 Tax=Arsenicibacter rosenii TaxID=1750698 RepID=A0A1S2VPI3_9BACT|nr:MarR family winged helix-turn-helix transcriptional regulator [Arsenicibacter rosenii]OIN60669.1 MarR family transcriptional regulator [Arsenicibacter rosenii]
MDAENYCIAGRLRMLSRIMTSLYNQAFEDEDVTLPQAGLLMYIFAQPGIRQVALGQMLHIEKSGMNRELQLLQRNGWLTDNLKQGLFLTEEGRIKAKRCHKIWKALNLNMREQLGTEALSGLNTLSGQIFELAQTTRTNNQQTDTE